MLVIIHKGHIVEARERELSITVRDEQAKRDLEFHWTSFWSDFPDQRPAPGGACEIMFNALGQPFAFKLAPPVDRVARLEHALVALSDRVDAGMDYAVALAESVRKGSIDINAAEAADDAGARSRELRAALAREIAAIRRDLARDEVLR